MAVPDYRTTITVRDSEGHESVVNFNITGAADNAAAVAAANAIRPLVEAITDGVVARQELTEILHTNAAIPGGNVDNELKATFSFVTADDTVTQVSIPAFDRSKLIANQSNVDTSDTDVAAFLAALYASPWTDSRAADIVSLRAAKESYSNRRKEK